MRYNQPWGISDPNGPYINGDPSRGEQGSIPPAAAVEHPQREIVTVISKAGFTPSDTNLEQLTIATRSQRLNYAIDTSGQPNQINVVYDPPITQYHAGLTLHVKVRNTNVDGQVNINAGAGNIPVRRMNNSDLGAGDLPINCIATLIHDGTAFQLSNFGGSGGDTNITQVNVPYAVDTSTAPGTIIVDFGPNIPLPLTQGDIIAVRCAQTAPGETTMYINGIMGTPYPLLPNGGGIMLQGDVIADDVVQFFFDGVNLRFPPNPEINAPVVYTVGAGQQFLTIDAAMAALKRKTIGANGYVTLQMIAGVVPGPINVAHPSGDRLLIRGTMLAAAPVAGDFRTTGNTDDLRAQDAIANLNMLRTRYGTEITIPLVGTGVMNSGAGAVQFQDLLIVGAELPMTGSWWDQNGVSIAPGLSVGLTNCSVWGSQVGFNANGGLSCTNCFACWCSHAGYHCAGSGMWLQTCGAFGNGNGGIAATFGSTWAQFCSSMMNGVYGVWMEGGGQAAVWWGNVTGNAVDLFANSASTIGFIYPGNFLSASPPVGVVGNGNSIITTATIPIP